VAAAIGLIVGLAGVLAWLLIDSASNDEVSEADAATVDAPPPVIVKDEEAWIAAAREALDAWARFAMTADLSVVDGLFDPDGPQYAQLEGEVETIATQPAGYSFTLGEATVEVRDGSPVVSGSVVVAQGGELLDTLMWDIHLVAGPDGSWLLWTVDDAG
jgi:hypothetical protein